MSAPVATSPAPMPSHPSRLIRGLLGSAAHFYGYAKQHSPALVVAGVDRLEHSFSPITEKIYAYGEPIVESLDSRIQGIAAIVPERVHSLTVSVYEQTKLYSAALKSWLAHGLDYEQYIATVRRLYGSRWSENVKTFAADLHTKLRAAVPSDDVLMLSAMLLAEGSDRVRTAFLQAWTTLSSASPKAFVEHVKGLLGAEWKQHLAEKAHVFYSLASLKGEINRAAQAMRARATAVVRKAKDVASRTTFILLNRTDKLVEASIVILDEGLVNRLCSSPPPSVPLRGFDRLAVMEQRLYQELDLFVSTKKSTVASSRPYRFVSDRVVVLRAVWGDLRAMSKDDVYAKAWPETVKSKVDSVLVFVGLESLVKAFNRSVWEKLDQDEDQVVTIGDLLSTASKARHFSPQATLRSLVQLYRDTYSKYVQFGRVNGDHQD